MGLFRARLIHYYRGCQTKIQTHRCPSLRPRAKTPDWRHFILLHCDQEHLLALDLRAEQPGSAQTRWGEQLGWELPLVFQLLFVARQLRLLLPLSGHKATVIWGV